MPGSARACSKWRRASAAFPRASRASPTGSSAPRAGAFTPRATASATASKEVNGKRMRARRRVMTSIPELREVHLVPLVDLRAKRDHAPGRAGDIVVHLGSRAYERV